MQLVCLISHSSTLVQTSPVDRPSVPAWFAEVVIMRLAEALELIRDGAIPDGKTALAILFAAGFRTGD